MKKIAVIIPCYKVSNQIMSVIAGIGSNISLIYVVDDACPDNTGKYVEDNCKDQRVRVLYNTKNLGVGGAVMTGYKQALADGALIMVKIDGDMQMDPRLIPDFIEPIQNGEADYTKGNRFYDLEHINRMPKLRLIGNSVLSFMNKISSGYWNIFDPTNGYTAIHKDVLSKIALSRVSSRYFFESDMLFRLNILKAVVVDIPMSAKYGEEQSHLKISNVLFEFILKHIRNFIKRIFYNYYLRDMSLASFELPLGILLMLYGFIHGLYNWYEYAQIDRSTPLGTIMISALALLFGLQFLLAFLAYDIYSVPSRVLHRRRL